VSCVLPVGFRVVTICGSAKPELSGVDDYNEILSDALRERRIDVHPIDLGHWGLAQLSNLIRKVAEAHPDAILMQYPTEAFGRSFTPHIFAMLQRIAPLVVTLHEFLGVHVLRRLSIGALLFRCALVIATAEREAQGLTGWFPWTRRRVRVIRIGPNMPSRAWLPAAEPCVVHFGQIRPRKGLEDFLACHDRLLTMPTRSKFMVIGARVAKFASYFDAMTDEIRRRNITLLTEVAADEVSDRLAASWIALLPFPDGASFRRGSMLAAAACGVPIVTRTGIDTPSDMAAMLSPATTVADMAALVSELLDSPSQRQAAHERSIKLAEIVGWNGITDSYVDAFLNLSQAQVRDYQRAPLSG
jgi:glycosyltransferase involved in cell wall biosynthesis